MSRQVFRVTPDTNVLLSAKLAKQGGNSPNIEFFDRWLEGQFILLFTPDTLEEYVRKLNAAMVPVDEIQAFIARLIRLGTAVAVEHYHLQKYPRDSDDTAFVLCATNGNASHLISYDIHLLELSGRYRFKICRTIEFLAELRKLVSESG